MLEMQKWLINVWEWGVANINVPFFILGVVVGLFLVWWVCASKGRKPYSKKLLFFIGFAVVFVLPFLYLCLYVWKVMRLFAGGNVIEIFSGVFLCTKCCKETKLSFKGLFDEKAY